MGLFGKKKEIKTNEQERLDEALRDDLSKAYDELMSGDGKIDEPNEETAGDKPVDNDNVSLAGDYDSEQFRSKLKSFKENKTDELLREILMMLPGRKFLLPSVSNMKQPFENVNGVPKLKKGASINPALLSSQDKKTFLPVFTDDKSMVQKSPSGVVLKFNFEQCLGIVYNKTNPVTGIVINPFTDNFILGEELLKQVFRQIEKAAGEKAN